MPQKKTVETAAFLFQGPCRYAVTAQLSLEELANAGPQERMNIFRRYFATSRYNRLLIQQALVKSAREAALAAKVKEMEKVHNQEFLDAVKMLKKTAYFEEFLAAVKEEDEALAKIIEAYDKRMSRG